MATGTTSERPQGTSAYAFGSHPVNGTIVKKTSTGSGNFAETTVTVVLGEGVWEAVDAVYWNGGLLAPDRYHFHQGNWSENMDESDDPAVQGIDPWNVGGQTYSGKAYIIVKLPTGVEEDSDFENLKMICRCKQVPDYDNTGAFLNIGYSTNPARCGADVLMNKFKLTTDRVNWQSWQNWKNFCDYQAVWAEGVPAQIPNWTTIDFDLIQNTNGGFRKTNITDPPAWTGARTLSLFNPITPSFGSFEVELKQGKVFGGFMDEGQTSIDYANLRLGFLADNSAGELETGDLFAVVDGSNIAIGTWAIGDKLKVKVLDGAGKLYKNNVEVAGTDYTFTAPQRGVQGLYFDVSATRQSSIAPFNSGTIPSANTPTWEHMTNIFVTNAENAGLIKYSGVNVSVWNAGATTTTLIPADTEGWIQWRTNDAHFGTYAFGLTSDETITSPLHMKIAAVFNTDNWVDLYKDGVEIEHHVGVWENKENWTITRQVDGSYILENSGTPIYTTAPSDNDKGALRGGFVGYNEGAGVEVVTFSHVDEAGTRYRKRFECGLAFTGGMDAAQILQSILYVSCTTMQDVDGKLTFFPPSMVGALREPTFAFNMGNIKEGTFKTYRVPRTDKPTLIEGKIRDIDTQFLSEATVPINRDAIVDLTGRENPGGDIYLGTITQAQASCVLNYHMRLNVDLDLYCTFEGTGETYPVAVGDIVTVYHDVPEWSGVMFIVTEASDLSSLSTADERRFVLRQFVQEIYSDTDQTALNSDVNHVPPTLTTPPPPMRDASLLLTHGILPDGNPSWVVAGYTIFDVYPFPQHARVFVSTDAHTETQFTGVVLTPDVNGEANFQIPVNEVGNYYFTFVTENDNGVSLPFEQHLMKSIDVVAPTQTIYTPTSYTAAFSVNTITHRWGVPSTNPSLVTAYEIWSNISNLNDLTKRVFRGLATSYTENFPITSTTTNVTRWIRATDGMGNYSSFVPVNGSGNVLINTLTTVSGYSLYFDGTYLIHNWTRNAASQNVYKYQIAKDAGFTQIVGEADSNTFAEFITTPATSYTRYIRAVDILTNAGTGTSASITLTQLAAPTVARNTNMSFPSAVGFNITPPGGLDRNQVMKTVVEVANSAGFSTILATIPFAGVVESVFITGQVTQTPTIYVRARYESSAQAGLNSATTGSTTWTFSTFGSGDIGANQIFDLHIRDVSARKIIAEQADFGLLFTNQLVSQDYAMHQPYGVKTERVTWRNFINTTALDNGGLQKTGGLGSTFDAGASSNRGIHAGDGYAEFVLGSVGSDIFYGLSPYDKTTGYAEMAYAFYVSAGSIAIYQLGVLKFTASETAVIGDILKVEISGSNVNYYLNGVQLYTNAPALIYPLVVDVAMGVPTWSTGIATISGVLENVPAPDTIWANKIGCAVIANNVLQKSVASSAWGDSGASSGDYAALGTNCFAEANATGSGVVAFGLGPQATDSYNDIYYGFVLAASDWYIYESGSLIVGGAATATDCFRVDLVGSTITYRRNGVSLRTVAYNTAQTPLRFAGAIQTASSLITGAHFSKFTTGKGWRLHPQQGSAQTGVGEFNDNILIKDAKLNEVMVRSMNAIDPNLRYRGNDATKVPVASITPVTLDSMFVNADNSVQVDLSTTIVGYGVDVATQSDSVKRVRTTVINKYGNVVKTVEVPFFGQGQVLSTRHSRKYADPNEEAIYRIEVYNSYGYAQPVYFNKGVRSTSFPALFNVAEMPTDASASAASDTEVRVSWTPAASNAGAQTVKYRQLGSSTWLDAITSHTSTSGTYVIQNLASNTDYEVKVGNNSVTNGFTNIVLVKTLSTPSAVPTFQPPSGLSGSAPAYNQIILNWVRNSTTNDAVDVEVDGTPTQIAAGTTTYTHGSLTASSTHTYRVRNSFSSNGNKSAWTNLITITTPPAANPNDPSNLQQASSSTFSIGLAWSANGSTGANIDWRIYGTSPSWTNTPRSVGAGVSTYNFTGLASNTAYEFRIRNTNGTNPSNTLLAYTALYEPPDPGCVLPETLILVWLASDNFVWKMAKDITCEDLLVSIDERGYPRPARIHSVITGKTTRIYSVLTENGLFVESSPSHPYICEVGNAVTSAYKLKPGDDILFYDEETNQAQLTKVAAIEINDLKYEQDVILFSMDSITHTLVTNGLVSHNRDNKE